MRLIAIFFSLILILASCESTTSNTETGAIEGVATQTGTNTPISGVQVRLGDKSSTTDEEGLYNINNIPYGEYELTATKSDYESYSATININSRSTSRDIIMTNSIESTVITGKVTETNEGYGISEVKITIAGQTDFTDANGHYQLTNVPQGTHSISAEKSGFVYFEGQVFLSSNDKNFDINMLEGTLLGKESNNVNEDLKLDSSPYYVDNNINLTGISIEFGVEIIAREDITIAIRDVMIDEDGSPVIFKHISNEDFSWEGLDYRYGGKLNNLEIYNAKVGINVPWSQGDVNISGIRIENSTYGITSKMSAGKLFISDVFISNPSVAGIKANHVIQITDSVIEGSDGNGIIANVATIKNSKVTGSKENGIVLNGGGWGYTNSRSTITNSTIINNGENGVVLNGGILYSLVSNIISNNQKNGIQANNGKLHIYNSLFDSNDEFGIFSPESSNDSRYVLQVFNKFVDNKKGAFLINRNLDGTYICENVPTWSYPNIFPDYKAMGYDSAVELCYTFDSDSNDLYTFIVHFDNNGIVENNEQYNVRFGSSDKFSIILEELILSEPVGYNEQ